MFVQFVDAEVRADPAMVVDDQTVRRCPHPDAVHIANWSRSGYYFREGRGDFRARF
jgi:hypothetical protein